MDYVFISSGNTVDKSCSTRKLIEQNDLDVWIVDDNDKPISPANYKTFDRLGISKDPNNIPSTKASNTLSYLAIQNQEQSDIDTLKAWNPDLAERLGY